MVEVHNQGFTIPQTKGEHEVQKLEKAFKGKALELGIGAGHQRWHWRFGWEVESISNSDENTERGPDLGAERESPT